MNHDSSERITEVRPLEKPSRSTGPKTANGRIHSSWNALKHGLAALHPTLLPGEDVATYESKADQIFLTLDPQDAAQAEVVASIADDLHRLERLGRIEQALVVARIEELLAQTDAADKASATAKALTALGTALNAWQQPPIPTERSPEFTYRLRSMTEAIDLVADTAHDVPAHAVETCQHLVATLIGKQHERQVPADAYAKLYQTAGAIMKMLLKIGDRDEVALDDLRKTIASVALPDERELRKVLKYRRALEESLHRRLLLLEDLRRLAAAKPVTDGAAERARTYRLALRVVA